MLASPDHVTAEGQPQAVREPSVSGTSGPPVSKEVAASSGRADGRWKSQAPSPGAHETGSSGGCTGRPRAEGQWHTSASLGARPQRGLGLCRLCPVQVLGCEQLALATWVSVKDTARI